MATVNGIFDLPGFATPPVDAAAASREAVPAYFAAYEEHLRPPILRPVEVTAVRYADDDPDGDLLVESTAITITLTTLARATNTAAYGDDIWVTLPTVLCS